MAKAAYLFITLLFVVGTQIASSLPWFSGPNFALLQAQQEAMQQQVFAQQEAMQKQIQLIQQQVFAHQQSIRDQIANNFNHANEPSSTFSSIEVGPEGEYVEEEIDDANEPSSAFSSIEVEPEGEYQEEAISPVQSGFYTGVGENNLLPSGNYTFSSSKSSSFTGPDGKTITRKSTTYGSNDNGKISIRTVHDS